MKCLYPDYSKQYNNTYKIRLTTLRSLINIPPNLKSCERIHDLNVQTDKCLIRGILFISSDLKTTIFDKLNPDYKKEEFKKSTYISKEVKYSVEDETGRIEIILPNLSDKFVCTGMCLGFIGIMKFNKFLVHDLIFPDQPIKRSSKCTNEESYGLKNKSVAFISGLEISKSNQNSTILKVISDYLSIRGISELVIFGCFFKEDFEIFKRSVETCSLKITLIPEYTDFGCLSYPLLPVHKNLFKGDVCSYCSPSIIDMCGKALLFSSKWIIKDLLKYIDQNIPEIQSEADGYRMHLDESKIDSTPVHIQDINENNILKIVKGVLQSRLLCPNGPDTLSVIPYTESEIFFIDKPVEYFIIPNCNTPIFIKEELTGCRIVSVPNFNDTKKVLVLDLFSEEHEFIEYTE